MTDDTNTVDPKSTALLVMDCQRGIVSRLNEPDGLLGRIAGAIDVARRAGILIGYVCVAFDDADYTAMPASNKSFAAVAAGRLMRNDAPETAIHDAVAPKTGDIVVRKTRVGAFSTTDLDRQLRERGIGTLVLAGIATSGVVLSTVRAAADMDYRLFVLADCCADPDIQVHDVLVGKVFPRQATVIDSAPFSRMVAAPGTSAR